MALIQSRRANLTESGSPEVVDARGHDAQLLRDARRRHSRAAAPTAPTRTSPRRRGSAVVSHRLWTRRYGADAALVGRTVRIDGEPTQVVGIAPAWMDEAGSPDLWMPARFNAGESADRQLRLERDRHG